MPEVILTQKLFVLEVLRFWPWIRLRSRIFLPFWDFDSRSESRLLKIWMHLRSGSILGSGSIINAKIKTVLAHFSSLCRRSHWWGLLINIMIPQKNQIVYHLRLIWIHWRNQIQHRSGSTQFRFQLFWIWFRIQQKMESEHLYFVP